MSLRKRHTGNPQKHQPFIHPTRRHSRWWIRLRQARQRLRDFINLDTMLKKPPITPRKTNGWNLKILGVSENGGKPPKWMVKIMEKPYFLMDDLGGKPTVFGNIQMMGFLFGISSSRGSFSGTMLVFRGVTTRMSRWKCW